MKLTVLAIAAAVVGFGGVVRGQTHEPMPGASQGQRGSQHGGPGPLSLDPAH